MGHIFQAECWARHPNVSVNWFIMAKGIWERKWKRFWKGKMAFLEHLFKKIIETMRKGR